MRHGFKVQTTKTLKKLNNVKKIYNLFLYVSIDIGGGNFVIYTKTHENNYIW